MSENDQPHLPPPSLWPIGFAVGVACVLTGIVVSAIVAVVGAVIALAFGFLWLRDVTKPVRTPAGAVEPEQPETYKAIEPPGTTSRRRILAAPSSRSRRSASAPSSAA